MIQGIGTDIIAIERIRQLKNKNHFINKILSAEEILLFESFKNENRQNEFLAGRFAVKEAMYKALGTMCEGWQYTDVVILNDDSGAPYIKSPELDRIHLSISHCREHATAFVIYEKI